MHRTDTAAERPAPVTVGSIALLLLALLILAGCGGRRDRVAAEPLSIRTPVPTFTPTATLVGGAPSQAPAVVAAPVESAPLPADVAPIPQEVAPEAPGTGGPVGPIEPLPPADPPPATPQPQPSAPAFAPPLAVINTELVNGRAAPDQSASVVLVLGRGEEYYITGKSGAGDWFRLCCALEQEVWAFADFVDTDGLVDAVPVAESGPLSTYATAILAGDTPAAAPVAQAAPAPEPAAAAPQAAPESTSAEVDVAAAARTEQPATAEVAAAEPAPAQPDAVQAASAEAAGYELVAQERFPETNVVRVFLYVYAENQALEGYSLRVTKDGAEQAVSGESWGGQPGLTWPIADERQRFQNFKVEFPGVAAAGTWTVELTQGGAVVGPAATFTLAANEGLQELYVRYLRK